MKAIVTPGYGPPDLLRVEDVPKPRPREGEVLVEVHAAALNPADWRMQRADPALVRLFMGLTRPRHRIPGADVAGRVAEVGPGVGGLRPGEEVFGELSSARWGAFAEHVAAPAKLLAPKPASVGFEEAAALPMAGLTALQAVRDHARVREGRSVVVNGASGGVGTLAVQVAKAFGAEVTGVCSTRNLDLVRSLGADHVVDYTREDFTRTGPHDAILDAAAQRPFADHVRALRPEGRYVLIGGATGSFYAFITQGPWLSWTSGRTFTTFTERCNRPDLEALAALVDKGSVKPVIDRRVPLGEVPRALAYLERGHARGKVVVLARGG